MAEKLDLSDELMEEAAEWWHRSKDGTAADVEALNTWLAADLRHAEAYALAGSVWESFDDHPVSPEILEVRKDVLTEADKVWKGRLKGQSVSRRQVAVGGIAAGLAAAVAVPIGLLALSHKHTFQTEVGEQRIADLSDGSKLTLDANSHVEVDFSDDVRNLKVIKGRAHFDVAKDPARPFRVRAMANSVTAVGTAFTVEVRKDTVAVTLFEGKVALAAARPDGTQVAMPELQPSQQAVMSGQAPEKAAVRVVNDSDEMGWTRNQLFFVDAPLEDVADRMNDYSRTRVSVVGAARSIRISGMYVAGQTGGFVDAVQRFYPVTAVHQADGIVIGPKA